MDLLPNLIAIIGILTKKGRTFQVTYLLTLENRMITRQIPMCIVPIQQQGLLITLQTLVRMAPGTINL